MSYKNIFNTVSSIKNLNTMSSISVLLSDYIYNISGRDIDNDKMITTKLNNDRFVIFVFTDIFSPLVYTYGPLKDKKIYDIFLVDKNLFSSDTSFDYTWNTIKFIYDSLIKVERNICINSDEEKKMQELASSVLTSLTLENLSYSEKDIDSITGRVYFNNYALHNSMIFKKISNLIYTNDYSLIAEDLLDNARFMRIVREEFVGDGK